MIHHLPSGQIHHARVETVYPLIEAGSVTLVHSDGPYGLDKAAWDKVRDLAAWYRPHIAEWGRICAPSASVYLWNTAEGWAAIHPEMVAAGWELRALVTWDKCTPVAMVNPAIQWADAAERCGYYVRGRVGVAKAADALTNVWRLSVGAYADEKLRSGEPHASGCASFSALHPCQKPLLFARRIVEASSRPGDLVFEPFGGTCRIAVACEDIARWEPEKARRYVCVEMDEDGRDYVPAVLASLRGEAPNAGATGQVPMFGGRAA
jgi:DNA modification methylase